jgi:sugar lactone lactonase YvrE
MMETSPMQSLRIRLKLRWLAMGLALAGLSPSLSGAQTPQSGIQATAATLALPAGVAYDSAGNLYLADLNNHIIREVNIAGIAITVAGTGEQGFSGDGGTATSALLDSPAGVAVDGAGNIYISDTHNHRIRKVSGGTITTIAGTGVAGFSGDNGQAVSATLNNPTALAVDSNGNLYIADTDNHRIRKITGTTISTIAGSGEQFFSGDGAAAIAAGLDSPNGVAVDAAGNIYIGDTRNQRIRVVNSSGTVSTLAGNGSKAYAGDGGAAAGSSLARPRGLSVDAQGNIYFADSDNNTIRLIANTGTITTVAGNGSQGFSGDGGAATSATLDTPRAPAVQAAGVFALSDTNNNLIREVGTNGIINTITGTGSGTGSGQGAGGEILTLSGTSTTAYGGSDMFTVVFSNAGKIAAGQVSLVDTANSSAPVASSTLSNNVATISVSTLSAGTHNLVVTFAGDGQNAAITSSPFALTITPLPVTASVASLSLQYGQAIPTITGTLSGVLAQDANNVTAVFTTTATAASTVSQYPISVTLTGSAAADYTVTLAAGSGGITIGKAASTVTLSSSSLAPFLGAPVTFTALAASSTTGTPSGTVSFYDGATLLITTPISNGSATYTSTGLAGGAHSITAVYSGDTNFTTSTSTAVVETVTSSPDFTLTPTGALTQSVTSGKSATYTFALQPQGGTLTSPITLTASGLPTGATAVFAPATIATGGSSATVSLTIQTASINSTSTSTSPPGRAPLLPISAALFLLPLLRNKHVRARFGRMPRTLFSMLFLLIAGAATLGLTGCGNGAHDPNSTYTVTVTASAAGAPNTTLQHTATVTLIVQ